MVWASDDDIIRQGMRAMLAKRAEEAERLAVERTEKGWSQFQIADDMLLKSLRANQARWSEFQMDKPARDAAITRFKEYAYQWY